MEQHCPIHLLQVNCQIEIHLFHKQCVSKSTAEGTKIHFILTMFIIYKTSLHSAHEEDLNPIYGMHLKGITN